MARILIVDNDSLTVEGLSHILRTLGHVVETADDGGEGMLKIGTFKPDLVLLDLMMPRINGWEFLDSKTRSEAAGIPVIIYSGWSNIPQPLPGNHIAAIVTKPVDYPELVKEIEKVVGG